MMDCLVREINSAAVLATKNNKPSEMTHICCAELEL
jgi:hypothetical protein